MNKQQLTERENALIEAINDLAGRISRLDQELTQARNAHAQLVGRLLEVRQWKDELKDDVNDDIITR